jgi:acetyl-CoA acetyltransferase
LRSSAYITGASCTAFGKLPGKSFKDLTREAYGAALADAEFESGAAIEAAWFSNCGMHTWGQANIRGQVCFSPLVQSGRFPERVPLINVDGACASGSLALHGAYVASGATALGGALPNLSGGLVAKGHPIGATGLSMIFELTQQLRGEAGERQLQGARHGLSENGGGGIGFDEAVCAVTILEGNS